MKTCHSAGVKKTKTSTPSSLSVLRQLCNLIPNHLVPKIARQTGVDAKARTFSPWSHVVSLIFSQISHAIGLNDVCDALSLHSGPLSAIRGATPPCRNTLSHANKQRDASMAENLFWAVLAHLQALRPDFGIGRRGKGLAHRFRRGTSRIIVGEDRGGRGKTGCESGSFRTSESPELHS